MTVAALYVDPRGPYPELTRTLDGEAFRAGYGNAVTVDVWDAERDARKYDGPGPIVAHPPCGPWGKLRHLYKGNEHDCAPLAVEQVRRWGGVLEHPAESLLWQEFHGVTELAYPGQSDVFGFTIEIDQCEWGHVARKPTWLYLVGVPRSALEEPPFPGRKPTHWCSGNRANKNGGSVPPGIKICSAQQRRRTPPLLAAYLVRLARAAVK